MRVWPCVPCELDSVSGVSTGVQTSCCSALVAVHISGSDGCGLYEADVLVQSVPASCLGSTIGLKVVPDRVGAVGDYSLDSDAFDEAVGGCSVKEHCSSAEEKKG